jgi:hypothetical protein
MHHPVETAVATAAALVALAFALSTLERWQAGRRLHEAAWSAALLLFAVAAGALATGAQGGWSGVVFRVFYLTGAIVDVPVLALGTVYLLAGEPRGNRSALGAALFAAFATGVVVTAPFTRPLPVDELVQGSRVFGPWPRILAAVGSAGGALVIFAGAAWSGWRVRRSGAASRLVWSNALIAVGTLILGGSGTLNSVFGAMTAFAVTLLIGIVVIFAGFLVATSGASGAGGAAGAGRGPAIAPAEPWGGSLPGAAASTGGGAGAGPQGLAQELPAQAVGQ